MKIFLLLLCTIVSVYAQSGGKILEAARKQIGVTTAYDPAYVVLEYPGGDVAADVGVCTDVIVRAMRVGLAKDLQQLLHEDMRRNFSAYPKNWGLARPDKNIDHRRVPNLATYFKRQGYSLAVVESKDPARFLPGDIVTCMIGKTLPHIMIVGDRKTDGGVLLVIHNIGGGAREEDCLFTFPMTGHFRVK
jgi:uncharacterized protein